MNLPTVLHPDVIDFLHQYSATTLHQQVWTCINKLRQRQFDGGLRVKTLKGVQRRVWEARINRSSRLIFTYHQSRKPETGEPQTYLAIQDICLEHDDVSQCVLARKRTPDTQWLDADLVEELGTLEQEYLSFDEQFSLELTQEEELQLSLEEVDELLGNIPWRNLVIDSQEEWEKLIREKDAELPLKLTPEEYEIVHQFYRSLVLSGSAGTGKTTVGLYCLLYQGTIGKSLYVAYNPYLVKASQEQFIKLTRTEISETKERFQFKTITQLCLEILKAAGKTLIADDLVDSTAFESFYRLYGQHKHFPTLLVWDEIRSIIKGRNLEPQTPLLSLSSYQDLGKKCSIIEPDQRQKIYPIAEWYQKKLTKTKRFDEIDLTREVLDLIQQGKVEKYQFIICDEVQDLTVLQLELLVQLVHPQGFLLFAGDTNQMISLSGFRWQDLTTRLYQNHRQDYQEKSLDYNFRSVQYLAQLSQQILKLKKRVLQKQRNPLYCLPEDYHLEQKARLIQSSIDQLKTTIHPLKSGDVILVRDETQRDQLRTAFNSSLIFTIEEAKGLEFDTVFLLDFFQRHPNLWQAVIQAHQQIKDIQIPQLTLEFNLLYVAITRCRQVLYIWEESISEIWNQQELQGFLIDFNIDFLITERHQEEDNWRERWRERGEYYLKSEYYRQAAECFTQAGETLKAKEATAQLFRKQGNYLEAARLFIELKNWQVSAELLERLQQWEKAAICWGKIGETEKQNYCQIYALEADGKILEAAQRWQSIQQWEKAALLFEKIKNWQSACQCYQNYGNLQKANICQIRQLEFEYQWEEAAQAWHHLGASFSAEERRCWLQSSNELKKAEYAAKDAEKQHQWLPAAQYYEKAEIFEKAIFLYEQEHELKSVARCRAKVYQRQHKWREAGEHYELAGCSELAQFCYEQLAVSFYEKGKQKVQETDYENAIIEFNKALKVDPKSSDVYKARAMIYQHLECYYEALKDWNQALRLNPEDPEAYRGRSKTYMKAAIADVKTTISFLEQQKFSDRDLHPQQPSRDLQQGLSLLEKAWETLNFDQES